MSGRKAGLAFALALVATLIVSSLALGAIDLTKPPTGTWKFGDAAGGFRLLAGKGKKKNQLFVTGIHSRTQNYVGCPEKSEPITVSGRFPLKVVKISKIYPVWAIGKPGEEKRYSDGNSGLISIPAQVKVGGKPVPGGGIKMEFNYEDPTEFSLLIIEFGGSKEEQPCITPAQEASQG